MVLFFFLLLFLAALSSLEDFGGGTGAPGTLLWFQTSAEPSGGCGESFF